jgi:hypothetical protein
MAYDTSKRRAIYQFTKEGVLVKKWKSKYQAVKALGVTELQLEHCMNGRNSELLGYVWRRRSFKCKEVHQYNYKGEYLRSWVSADEVSRKYRVRPASVNNACLYKKFTAGFYFSYHKNATFDI